jgi:hypothetical protein
MVLKFLLLDAKVYRTKNMEVYIVTQLEGPFIVNKILLVLS